MFSRRQNADLHDLSDQLADAAFDVADRVESAHLAREALKIAPDTIDAYIALAAAEDSPAEQIALLREGVKIGERQWETIITQQPQKFTWNELACRPYLRALHNLMVVLDEIDEVGEATLVAQRIITINPADNTGARYQAVIGNIELGNWQSAERVLRQYREDKSACFAYSRVLLCLQNQGNAKPVLANALKINRHVPPIMGERIQKPHYERIARGSPEEARSYVFAAANGWRGVAEAIPWLKNAAA